MTRLSPAPGEQRRGHTRNRVFFLPHGLQINQASSSLAAVGVGSTQHSLYCGSGHGTLTNIRIPESNLARLQLLALVNKSSRCHPGPLSQSSCSGPTVALVLLMMWLRGHRSDPYYTKLLSLPLVVPLTEMTKQPH